MNISENDLAAILGNARRIAQKTDQQYGVRENNVPTAGLQMPGQERIDERVTPAQQYDNYDLAAEEKFNSDIDNYVNIRNNSKIPEAIKRSMMENQIDTRKLEPTSALDRIKPVRQVNEQKSVQQNGGLEETIMECLDKYFKQNSGLKTISLGEGKIRLIDNSGRIFVANLEYKGNVNDKKKK